MSTQTLDELLVSDIDDLTELSSTIGSDARHALLSAAAEALGRPDLPSRFKLIRFVQALAASEPTFSDSAAESVAVPLITAAHANDPTERLAALRCLAVVTSRTETRNLALTHSILATFEHARIDSSPEIRAFANELLSADNPVFRRLIAVEAATAGAGKMALLLETLLDSAHTMLDGEGGNPGVKDRKNPH
jgi:hypothetical protein